MADDLLRDANGIVIPQQYEQDGQYGILTTSGSLYNGPINASLKRDRQGIVIPSQVYNDTTGKFEMASNRLFNASEQNKRGDTLDSFFIKDWVQMVGTMELDKEYVKTGSESVKVSGPAGSSPFIRSFRPFNLKNAHTLLLRFYVHSEAESVGSIGLFFPNDTAFENMYEIEISGNRVTKGWNELIVPFSDFTATGLPDKNQEFTRFQIRVNQAPDQIAPVTFDSLTINPAGKAKVLFTFDDQWREQYDIAFTEMRKRGLVGTIAVNGGTVGASSYMTWPELDEVQAYGWGLVNHTYDHLRLGTLSKEEQREDIVRGQDALKSRGYAGADVLFYPYGSYNDATLDLLKELHIRSARSIKEGFELTPPTNRVLTKIVNLLPYMTAEMVKAKIDAAIQFGGTLIFLNHRIGAEGDPDNMFWDVAKFIELLDHAYELRATGKIDVITYNEWVNQF